LEGDGGTGVYMWECTAWRVMAVNRPYGEFYGLYSVSLEYFGYHHVFHKYKTELHITGTQCTMKAALWDRMCGYCGSVVIRSCVLTGRIVSVATRLTECVAIVGLL
jgi:hypothetical protein